MPDWDNDELLAARCSDDGDTVALEILYRRHVAATYMFARKFLTTREDAEEATSESWLRAVRALRMGNYRGESRFKTWLLGIVRFVCLERVRQPRLPTLSLSALTENGRGDWLLFPHAADPVSALDSALASLSDDYRVVLTLIDLQGFSATEASEVIVRSVAATRSLHGRARRALRCALLRENEEDS